MPKTEAWLGKRVLQKIEFNRAVLYVRVEALARDLGLSSFATDRGDLLGQGLHARLYAYDRKIFALAANRQQHELKNNTWDTMMSRKPCAQLDSCLMLL